MTHLLVELTPVPRPACSATADIERQSPELGFSCSSLPFLQHTLTARSWSQPEQTHSARHVRIGSCLLAEVVSLASSTALFTSPKQHAPEGFLTSHAQRPAFTSALMRAGMLELPVSATSRRTSARLKLKQ